MAGEVHELGDQLSSVRPAEGAAARNLLLQVDCSVTSYIVQLKTHNTCTYPKMCLFCWHLIQKQKSLCTSHSQNLFCFAVFAFKEGQHLLCRTFRHQRMDLKGGMLWMVLDSQPKAPAERRAHSVRTKHSAVVHIPPCCPHSSLASFIP